MPEISDTHFEYVGEGYYVTTQHCEAKDAAGEVCNEYLGVNYPSIFCSKHRDHTR
jgi:hypothetical protein